VRYAEIAVNVPLRPSKSDDRASYPLSLTFHYSIPEGMAVQVGQLVWVPFGARFCQGIVVALSDRSPVQETKDIISTIDPQPVLTGYQVELARWISHYYLCPLLEALRAMLPSGIERRVTTTIVPVAAGDEAKEIGLTPGQKSVLDLVRSRNGLELEEIRRGLRTKNVGAIVSQLMRRGLVIKLLEMERPRVRPKFAPTAWLAVEVEEAQKEVARLTEPARRRARVLQALLEAGGTLGLTDLCARVSCKRETVALLVKKGVLKKDAAGQSVSLALGREQAEQLIRDAARGPKGGQAGALAALIAQAGPLELVELYKIAGISRAGLQALARKGLVSLGEREVWRTPRARLPLLKKAPIFTPRQEQAWQEIQKDLAAGPRAILLHGVTGSGKTEIYIRALGEVVRQGKQGIVMVPEIALTPQTIQSFVSRFPGRVAVLHSRLSLGEQFDEWRRARDGLVDVVIGPRSAIFAPLPRPGLLVIDEEHEWTYKQQEHSPRYHTRDVALKLSELTGALVILGSATPDIATYQRAKEGEFVLLELPERIKVAGREAGERLPTTAPEVTSLLPPVEIVDLREELRAGNRSIFSRSLRRALEVALAAGQQRSEERRVGKECRRLCRSRWSPYH
jgi:primosomal protein N' (replication factor Y)